VFLDYRAIGDDGGGAADGCPFSGGVEEGNVDLWVGLDVICLAGFSVGVEYEVEAAALLVMSQMG
jgi:hypothetical protein